MNRYVAAVGFELYRQLIDEAVADLARVGRVGREPEPVRFDIGVNAYLPAASYVPSKRPRSTSTAGLSPPGDPRQITDELIDRFGPPAEDVENLITLQQAPDRPLPGRGAGPVPRRQAHGLLESSSIPKRAAAIRESVPGALYEWRP